MKKYIIFFIIISYSNSVFAQNQNKPPEFQAVANKLMEEINNNLLCQTSLINDRLEIQRLKAEIEKLKKDKQ